MRPAPRPASEADRTDPIWTALIEALYGNIGNQTLGGIATSAFLAAGAAIYSDWAVIAAWLAVQAMLQIGRLVLWRRYQRRVPGGDMGPWAHAYLGYIVLQGLLWGSTMWLFVHEAHPLSVALTLSCLYAVVCGSIPGNAYHPPSINVLMALVFGSVVVRLTITAELAYVLVGIASFFFLLVVFGIARTQHRVLSEGVRIRFENAALLEKLRAETAAAEAARRAAEQANLAKSRFLAAASHDLRQPLYALGLFSSSLDAMRLDADGRDVVRRIQDSIGVMEGAFEGLLDLSKLEAGVVAAHRAPVDIDALFDRISQVFRPLAIERGIELRLRSDGEWVMSDAVLIEQVIGNLVSNAIRATENGGVLLAARRGRDNRLRFEIFDTGRGIAADDVKRIFEDYVQLDNPERDRRRGMGLGLAIARRSVALLGAQIDVVSRPGRGSRFGFVQDLTEAPRQRPATERGDLQTLARAGLPVLIVEDDADVRAALCDLLARWQVPHEAVADGESALQTLDQGGPYGLVITDQRLTGALTGLEMVRTMRERLAEPPPAVIITGETDAALLASAAAEDVPVLHKPVRPADLRRLVGADR